MENYSRQSTALIMKAIENVPRDHESFLGYGEDYDTRFFAQ